MASDDPERQNRQAEEGEQPRGQPQGGRNQPGTRQPGQSAGSQNQRSDRSRDQQRDGHQPAADGKQRGQAGAQPSISQQELQRRVEKATKQAQQEEERSKAESLFSRDQLIEEGSKEARDLYGKSKVGDEDDWYTLVDVFLMLPKIIENEFAKRFRKRAGMRNWESRFNRRLIPMKYVYAVKSIERALENDAINPLLKDRIFYIAFVKMPPTLAYYDAVGPSKEEAKNWALYEVGELSREEVLGIGAADDELEIIKRRGDLMKKKFEKAKEKLHEAERERRSAKKGTEEFQRAVGKVKHYASLTKEYQRKYNDLKDEYEALKQTYDEVD